MVSLPQLRRGVSPFITIGRRFLFSPPPLGVAGKTLEGVTVVALEQAISAPLCTRHLADLGARVIKIERHGEGDYCRTLDSKMKGLSSHFVWVNRGKESIAIDVKKAEGVQIVKDLVAHADVFVQNLAPGAAARLGLGVEDLRAKHPKLIACSISGYGPSGPYYSKKAYDLLVQAESGLVSITGTEEEPSKVGIPIADIASGMYAYSGILSALYVKATRGLGNSFEVSMLDALGDMMGYPFNSSQYNNDVIPRKGAFHASIAPYGPFVTRDGKGILVAVQSNREWKSFCEGVLKKPELTTMDKFIDNSSRVRNRGDLLEIVQGVFGSMSLSEAEDRLDKSAIACGQMRTVKEALSHPQWKHLERWTEVSSQAGTLKG
jgi:itaconate CoA-transferase